MNLPKNCTNKKKTRIRKTNSNNYYNKGARMMYIVYDPTRNKLNVLLNGLEWVRYISIKGERKLIQGTK